MSVPRDPRRAVLAVVVAACVVLVAATAVGWHYANEILGPDLPLPPRGQTVLAHTDSTLTLVATGRARRSGQWAVEWDGGYGGIGPLLAVDDDRVVTRFRRIAGPPPDTTVRLASFARDADPGTWLGLGFEEFTVPGRVGPLPAWLVPGADSTWAIFVHGRGATRAEMLRMLHAFHGRGLPCLVVSYRNDPGAPRVGDGRYRLGTTEWRDLEDAVRAARARGARDVVLVGASMGGGIVLEFMRRAGVGALVRTIVLDAPVLDWNPVLEVAARDRGVPRFVAGIGKTVAAWRGGIRWDDLDQVRHAGAFSTPILILHGDADATVPIALSDAFANARPDLVTLVRTRGAGHVQSANREPVSYAGTVWAWLEAHGIGAAPAPVSADASR